MELGFSRQIGTGERDPLNAVERELGQDDAEKGENREMRGGPAVNGMLRKIQLARMSSGREKTTRAPKTQSPINMTVEASSGTESDSQGPPSPGPVISGGAFRKRIANAKPTPR